MNLIKDVPLPDMFVLAQRLAVPARTMAILWDMDGVLLDTLSLDYAVVNRLLAKTTGIEHAVGRDIIRRNFAFHPPEFWRRVLAESQVQLDQVELGQILRDYEDVRRTASAPVHDGVVEIMRAARETGIRIGVVSNNPGDDVRLMLSNCGLLQYVDVALGNDLPGLRRKPFPDAYLAAAERLSVSPDQCVVVEDSLLGAEAGYRAGCFTVGVATGANTLQELSESSSVSLSYESFR